MRWEKEEIKFNLLSNSVFWRWLSLFCPVLVFFLFKSILLCASLQSRIPNHGKLHPARLEGSSEKCWLRFWWNHEIFVLHIQHLNMLNIKILKDDKCSFFSLHPFYWSLYLSCILNFIFNWLLLEFYSALNLIVTWVRGAQNNESTKTAQNVKMHDRSVTLKYVFEVWGF